MAFKTRKRQNPWIQHPQPRPEARLRIFCFPYAGGGASAYREWAGQLPPDVELCPVQLPGRENRLLESSFDDLNLLVQVLLPVMRPWLDRPFALFGHSMGTLMVYELARQLKLHWEMEPAHMLVSGRYAPHWQDREPFIHGLPDMELLQTIQQRYGGIPEVVWEEAELRDLVLPTLRADFTLIERYVPPRTPRLTCPITAFGGLGDPLTNQANLHAWQELTDGPFALHMLPGEHFFIEDARTELLTLISESV